MSGRRRSRTMETTKLLFEEDAALVPPTPDRRAALVVLQGGEADIGTHRWLDRPIVMGRDPLVELPLDDRLISRRHCRVDRVGDEYFVQDLGSTNGTLLNNVKIQGRARLSPGDRIFLGGIVVKFTFSDDPEVTYHVQMDALASTDELTGLVAKRRFDPAYARALAAARRHKKPLSVLMLDLDGLKQINDTHGHPVGAHAISEVGKIIGEVVMPHGAACRLGGDEFAAFLRGIEKPVAVQFAESIRKWVSQHRIEKGDVVVRPTISIGVAAFPDDGRTTDQLLRRADLALYRAKNSGRDRVES